MTIEAAERWLAQQIRPLYGEAEAMHIAAMVLERLTGLQKNQRKLHRQEQLNVQQLHHLTEIHTRLQQHEPVQYILNEAWFYDFPLYVDSNVLIPRPETAELVDWIIKDVRAMNKPVFHKAPAQTDDTTGLKILDIGTGSGCIALALKKKMPLAEVWGCDASEGALNVARRNGAGLNIRVDFVSIDFLNKTQQRQLPNVDIIVSNPPYIPAHEQQSMMANVVLHEPHVALFVPDDDPLLFYKAIAQFGQQHLNPKGAIYFEIHETYGMEIQMLLNKEGYTTDIRTDMQGKERMVKAMKS